MIDESRWPFDPVGYVFLARAVNELGAACWGEQWTGKELACGTVNVDTTSAANLLWSLKNLPRSHPLQAEFSSFLVYRERVFANWEHHKARLESHPEFSATHDASRRLKHVQDGISRLCEAGLLNTYMRPVVGGALDPMPADWWRSERLHSRFHDFQVDAWAPFGSSNLRKDLRWVFIAQDCLVNATDEVRSAKAFFGMPLETPADVVHDNAEHTSTTKAPTVRRRQLSGASQDPQAPIPDQAGGVASAKIRKVLDEIIASGVDLKLLHQAEMFHRVQQLYAGASFSTFRRVIRDDGIVPPRRRRPGKTVS